jgi:hypothetical protein
VQQGDGGLGPAFFDALDLIGGHADPRGQVVGAQARSAALVMEGLVHHILSIRTLALLTSSRGA